MNGKVVQILGPKEKSFNLDTDVLFEILTKIGSCRFAIYSINGPKQSGKSFLLDKFLYYIQKAEEKGWFEKSLKSKKPFQSNNQTQSIGGINIWSEPIFIQHEGEKIAILLIDCNETLQVEDDGTTWRDNVAVFAWSRLLSSVFIYNSIRGIDQQALQSFRASQDYLQYQLKPDDNRFENENLYQNSMLLIRDWSFSGYDFGYYDPKGCSTQMNKSETNSSKPFKINDVFKQEKVAQFFEGAPVYLLPHPGNSFAMYSKENNLDSLFSLHSKQFIELMRQQIKLKKTTTGCSVTGEEFKDQIKFWSEILTREKIPLSIEDVKSNRCENVESGNSSANIPAAAATAEAIDPHKITGLSPPAAFGTNENASNCENAFVFDEDEKQLLEDWICSGKMVFLKNFNSLISKELPIQREDRKYQKTTFASKVLENTIVIGAAAGITAGAATGAITMAPLAGVITRGLTRVGVGSVLEKVGNVVLGNLDERKRKNLLSWTNTLNSKAEKEFEVIVSTGMSYICIAYKDLLNTITNNDDNKLSFFHDTTRRIFNYLSEHASEGKQLSPEMIFDAFLKGRSTFHPLVKKRGLDIESKEKKLSTQELFEEAIVIVKDGISKFYIKQDVDEMKNFNEFRYVFEFENQNELLKGYKKVESQHLSALQLQNDWRQIPNAIQEFIQIIVKPKDTDRKNSSDLQKENNELLRHICEHMNLIGDKLDRQVKEEVQKEEKLIPKWWPERKALVNAFYERKLDGKTIIEHIMELLLGANNKMVVITQKAKASGLGGIGKTSTAKWFANHYQEDYQHIFWIDSGEESLLKSFKDLAMDLKINFRHELDLKNLARKCFEKMWKFKCLWVFDNAERYQGELGIKDVLPQNDLNFHCIITSRCTDWGNKTGHGITDFQMDVFGINESYEFVKNALNPDIQFKDSELKTLCDMLGNLPLALQLTVATLNNGKLDIKDMISKVDSSANIFNEKFDDYEKTINKNMQISLDLIQKEPKGKMAFDLLTVFGYVRSDDVDAEFLRRVGNVKKPDLMEAVELLEKYSLVTKTGTDTKLTHNDSFWNKVRSKRQSVDVDLLSMHRLLQQTIRINGKDNERKVLKKILQCEGYLEYKMQPYTYADEKLKREFRSIGAKLIDQMQLEKLIVSGNFVKAVDLAKFISQESQSSASLYNYAVCLEKFGETKEALEILNNLLLELKKEDESELKFNEENAFDLMDLNEKLTKSTVWHKIISIYTNQLHKLFNDKKFHESLTPAKYLSSELQFSTATVNYAICLSKCGKLEEALDLLQNLYPQVEKPIQIPENVEFDILLALSRSVDKLMVKTQIFFLQLIALKYDLAIEAFEGIYELVKFRKENQRLDIINLTYLVNVLKVLEVQGYCFTYINGIVSLQLNGDTKTMELCDCCIQKTEFPSDLERFVLNRVWFLDQRAGISQISRLSSEIVSTKMHYLQLNCYTDIIVSLEDMASLRYLYLNGCTVLVDKKFSKITPRELGLQNVNFIRIDKNAEADVELYLNEFFNFTDIRKLKLSGMGNKKELIFDNNQRTAVNEIRSSSSTPSSQFTVQIEEIPSVEYLYLSQCSVILRHGHRVCPKELHVEEVKFKRYNDIASDVHLKEFVDFKNIYKLFVNDKDICVDMSDDIHMDSVTLWEPNIIDLEKVKWNVNKFSFYKFPFTSQILTTIKEIEIHGSVDQPVLIDLIAIPKSVEKITFGQKTKIKSTLKTFSLTNLKYLNVEETSTTCLALFKKCTTLLKIECQCQNKQDLLAVLKYLQKPKKTVSIGSFYWKSDAYFKQSFAKRVDSKSEFYQFENSKGRAIEKQQFIDQGQPYMCAKGITPQAHTLLETPHRSKRSCCC